MIGINAFNIITSMTNKKTFCNRSIMKFIGKSMRTNTFTFHFESAVAIRTTTSSPKPTTLCLINFTPKAFHIGTISQLTKGVN